MKIVQARVVNNGIEAWIDAVRIEGPMLLIDAPDEAWFEMAQRDLPGQTLRLIEVLS